MAGVHLGEFEDAKTYSHKRVAAIMSVNEEWVKDRLLFPRSRDGVRLPGVRYAKVGAFYMITGEAIRLWVESIASPDDPEETAA
ncbi:MAG: hypothetical protein GXX96_35325 [Planctomycetaceae bacterium]|nr:hypothetical protein [Planctomycetaceae bacterium]